MSVRNTPTLLRTLILIAIVLAATGLLTGPAVASVPAPEAAPAAPLADNPACGSDPALVGCWQFSEGSGTTTADGSGKGNTGTLVAGTGTTASLWAVDRFGNPGMAVSFTGSQSQYVKVPDSNSLDLAERRHHCALGQARCRYHTGCRQEGSQRFN